MLGSMNGHRYPEEAVLDPEFPLADQHRQAVHEGVRLLLEAMSAYVALRKQRAREARMLHQGFSEGALYGGALEQMNEPSTDALRRTLAGSGGIPLVGE